MEGRMLRKVGPTGNKSGKVWDQKGQYMLKQLIISYEPQKINALEFQYEDEHGNFSMSEVFGNQEFVGSGFCAVKFEPSEYLCLVHGWYNALGLEELTVSTNKRTCTFGKGSEIEGSQSFWYELGELNQFGGFHGTCDFERITSIGVYFKPNVTTLASSFKDLTMGDVAWLISAKS